MEKPIAPKDCQAYCPVCRKVLFLQAGQEVPRCCGKTMQVLD